MVSIALVLLSSNLYVRDERNSYQVSLISVKCIFPWATLPSDGVVSCFKLHDLLF